MKGIDFLADRYQSEVIFDTNVKKEKVTSSETLPDYSMALDQGENTSSNLALATTFHDNVKKYQVHITTKLVTAPIIEILILRRGAMNAFEAGDAQQINQVIFYAVLRSLDKMTEVGQNY